MGRRSSGSLSLGVRRSVVIPSIVALAAAFAMFPGPATAGDEDPRFVTSALWAALGAVEVRDGRAFLASMNGLAIYDVAAPEAPVLFGRVDLPGSLMHFGYGFDVAGSRAFLARHDSGVRIVDVSDPTDPREVGSIPAYGGNIWDVAVKGDNAYLASGFDRGLQIYNVSDPASPQWVGGVALPGWALRITIDGTYAYVSNDHAGLAIIDIANPSGPFLVTHAPPAAGPVWAVHVSDGVAYCTYSGGAQGGDLAAMPSVGGRGGSPLPASGECGDPRAYDPSGMIAYDVSDPKNPVLLSVWPNSEGTSSVFVRGGLAYLGSSFGSLAILDVSDPREPVLVDRFATGGDAYDAVVEGTVAYVADGAGGFTTVDVADPGGPLLLGNSWEASIVGDVRLRGDTAVAADPGYGIHVVDVRDPQRPAIAGALALPGRAIALEISGDHAYVACYDAGLQIVDLSNPEDLRVVASLATPANHIAVSGVLACIVSSYDELRVVSVADPEHPAIIGSCPLPDWPRSVTMEGSFAYVACGDAGMRIVDLSDPTHPYVRGSFDPYGYVGDVLVRSGIAYLSISNHGRLEVVDVSNPDDVRWISELEVGLFVEEGCLVGDRLFLATNGIAVVDVTLPEHPTLTGFCPTHCRTRSVRSAGAFLYAADVTALMIFGSDVTAAPESPGIDFPVATGGGLRIENPVRERSMIHWRLSEAGFVRMDVIDVTGVRRCVVYEGPADSGEVSWSLNPRALGLASGAYFLRAQAGARVESRLIQVVR